MPLIPTLKRCAEHCALAILLCCGVLWSFGANLVRALQAFSSSSWDGETSSSWDGEILLPKWWCVQMRESCSALLFLASNDCNKKRNGPFLPHPSMCGILRSSFAASCRDRLAPKSKRTAGLFFVGQMSNPSNCVQ